MITAKFILNLLGLIVLVNIIYICYFSVNDDALKTSTKKTFFIEIQNPDDPDFYDIEETQENEDFEYKEDSEDYNDQIINEEDAKESEDPDGVKDVGIEVQKSDSTKFDNPVIAYQLLTLLDTYSMIPKNFLSNAQYTKSNSKSKKYNNRYCMEHRAYIVNHPELVFEGKNYITNFNMGQVRTKVFREYGVKDLSRNSENLDGIQADLRPDINMYFMSTLWFYIRQVGKQFSCLTQISNHIPGHHKIYFKDSVGEALVQYAKKYESRPQCFGFTKYFPKTWVLKHKDQCEDFFAEFKSELYQKLKDERNVVYFRKIGANVHQGKGVFPVTTQEENKIRKIYQDGQLCGKVLDNNLIQYNVHNTVLIQNRKIGFRMFMLVASTNPIIAFYHDGYCRLSVNEYSTNSTDKSTFVTNIHVNVKLATQGTSLEGLSERQIQEQTFWLLEDVHNYFYGKGMVKDPQWLNNTLKPEFKKVMIHLIRLAQSGFYKQSSLYELYGLDFVMDENLDLWFIEGNTKPLIRGVVPKAKKLLNKMIKDSFDIVFGLLRSRMKRIVTFINLLTKEAMENGGDLKDINKRKGEFQSITRNAFEPEFQVSAGNGFEIIIDENENGTRRFADLITDECL